MRAERSKFQALKESWERRAAFRGMLGLGRETVLNLRHAQDVVQAVRPLELCGSLGADHGRRRGSPSLGDHAQKVDPRRCLGCSRGGLGTKIHALANQDSFRSNFTSPLSKTVYESSLSSCLQRVLLNCSQIRGLWLCLKRFEMRAHRQRPATLRGLGTLAIRAA